MINNTKDLDVAYGESYNKIFGTLSSFLDGLFVIADIVRDIFLMCFRNVRLDCWSIGSCPNLWVMSRIGF